MLAKVDRTLPQEPRWSWEQATEPVPCLMAVDVSSLVEWLSAIPFTDWPQQDRVNGELRPAMVTDLSWHGFGMMSEEVIQECLAHFPDCVDRERMLSVVMPGHSIPPHTDRQNERWVTRIHVPLLTNPDAAFVVEGVPYHLEVGKAYLVDTRKLHAVVNDGPTPRVHFMVDVWRASCP